MAKARTPAVAYFRTSSAANVVAEAKRLYRASPLTGERRSLRTIAKELVVARPRQREWKALQRQVRQEHDQGSATCLERSDIAASATLGVYR
jgi:hypothetical protein